MPQLFALLILVALVYWLVKFVVQVLTYAWPFLLLIFFAVIGWKFYEEWAEQQAERRAAEAKRVEELVHRADEQHQQLQAGQLDGIYGAYPVPDSVRGMGIWLSEKDLK